MKELDYLKHHGILGMKWGQRNGPPYPLTYSQMNSKEKKANKFDKKKNYINKQEYKNLTIYEKKIQSHGTRKQDLQSCSRQ